MMHYPPERKLDVHATAIAGLLRLETDARRRARYAGFIDIHASLSDDERVPYRECYPEEAATLADLTARLT